MIFESLSQINTSEIAFADLLVGFEQLMEASLIDFISEYITPSEDLFFVVGREFSLCVISIQSKSFGNSNNCARGIILLIALDTNDFEVEIEININVTLRVFRILIIEIINGVIIKTEVSLATDIIAFLRKEPFNNGR